MNTEHKWKTLTKPTREVANKLNTGRVNFQLSQSKGNFNECANLRFRAQFGRESWIVCLPAGQLSFLLRTGLDALPFLLNLRHWKIQIDAKFELCDKPIIQHILNGCPMPLTQSCCIWRHDSALKEDNSFMRILTLSINWIFWSPRVDNLQKPSVYHPIRSDDNFSKTWHGKQM